MAWGIFMTFVTLFGMMALACREAIASRIPSGNVALEGSARKKPDLRKAA